MNAGLSGGIGKFFAGAHGVYEKHAPFPFDYLLQQDDISYESGRYSVYTRTLLGGGGPKLYITRA